MNDTYFQQSTEQLERLLQQLEQMNQYPNAIPQKPSPTLSILEGGIPINDWTARIEWLEKNSIGQQRERSTQLIQQSLKDWDTQLSESSVKRSVAVRHEPLPSSIALDGAVRGVWNAQLERTQHLLVQLEQVQRLPESARRLQAQVRPIVQALVTQLQEKQRTFRPIVQSMQERIGNIENLANTQPITALTALNQLETDAKRLQTDLAKIEVLNTQQQLINLSYELQKVYETTSKQATQAQVQLSAAQQAVQEIQSKQKYFYALGIFGLIGLAALAIVLAVQNSKVQEYQQQQQQYQQQITQFEALMQAVQLLLEQLSRLVESMVLVKNAVDSILSTVNQIKTSVSQTNTSTPVIKLYIQMVKKQLEQLSRDMELQQPDTMQAEMRPGTMLRPEEFIFSKNGRFRFIYQHDGNLVLYDGNKPIWASGTYGLRNGQCKMQADGNLVIYLADQRAVWSSDTWRHPGSTLRVGDDGIVAIVRPDGVTVWSTKSGK
jgi:hypothetical protein